jgi:hypothetical protein
MSREASANELRMMRKEAGEDVAAYFGRAAGLFEAATRFTGLITEGDMKQAIIAGMGATYASLRIRYPADEPTNRGRG